MRPGRHPPRRQARRGVVGRRRCARCTRPSWRSTSTASRPTSPASTGSSRSSRTPNGLRVQLSGSPRAVLAAIRDADVTALRSQEASLEEIFLAYYGDTDGLRPMTTTRPELAVARLAAREIRNGLIVLVVAAVLMIVAVISAASAPPTSRRQRASTSCSRTQRCGRSTACRSTSPTPAASPCGASGPSCAYCAGLWARDGDHPRPARRGGGGRWDLLLTAPVTRGGVLLSHVKVLGGGSVVVGLAVFGSFVAGGEPAGPAALYALGVDVPHAHVRGRRCGHVAAVRSAATGGGQRPAPCSASPT